MLPPSHLALMKKLLSLYLLSGIMVEIHEFFNEQLERMSMQ
jgi:hypothetical protein